MDEVDAELQRRYRGLVTQQLTEAAGAALKARWLARDMRTRAEELLCAASTAGPARARRLRATGNRLVGCAEQLEALAGHHRQASTVAEAALDRGRNTTAATDEDHPG